MSKPLSEREQMYWDMMSAQSGVLFLQGRPGEAKTAIIESIARKVGCECIDLRLSQMDETDIGLYPMPVGNVVKHLVPEWAAMANEKPTIIFFDELNRSRECVRNAALQILNERRIGYSFKFNEDVYMCSAGNYGNGPDSDGTEVEDFDAALWNRLLPVKHTLTIDEWATEFANEHVWSYIISYINAHPENFYRCPSAESKQYATPRSWTFLSNQLKRKVGKGNINDITVKEAMNHVRLIGASCIGVTVSSFLKYLADVTFVSIIDIINHFDSVEDKVMKLTRPQMSELIGSLKSKDFKNFTPVQISNVIKFLELVAPDERVGYLTYGMDNYVDTSTFQPIPNFKKVWNAFKEESAVLINSHFKLN